MLFKEDLITESVGLSLDQLSTAPALKTGKTLYYYVYGGNYPEIVSNALAERGNWQQCKEAESIEKCHFVWRPFNFNPENYKRIDKRVINKTSPFIYNHLEVLKGLTTKSGLVRSLKHYYYNNDAARKLTTM
jgi:hypothetical protein